MIFGQRNADSHKSPARNGTIVDGIVRLHPIESWSDDEVREFLLSKMDVPAHYAFKHTSLDCYDCTAFHKESADRIEWMQSVHPDFYEAYNIRRAALTGALSNA